MKIFSTIIVAIFLASIICLNSGFAQQKKQILFMPDVKDVAFRLVGMQNAEWTEYKKKKLSDEYFHFLDSAKAIVTIRVPLKDYSFDARKKTTTIYTLPAEFIFEAEEEMKLRVTLDPILLKGDSLLMELEVKKEIPTYLEVTGKFTKPRLGEVQATPREKRKELRLNLAETRVVQSKDKSENPYVFKKHGKIIDHLAETIEKRKLSEGFDLAGLGFRKIEER